jgi:hypothetical protein
MPSTFHRWDPRCPPPGDLFTPVPIDPRGAHGPTRGQAAGPRWRRTSHGLYVPVEVDRTMPEQRILEQAVRLPTEGAVTGWAACRLHGANFFDGMLPDGRTEVPVPLVVGPTRRLRVDAHVTISHDRMDPDDRAIRYGIPCTTVRRALFDAMRVAVDLREAVVAMDMMAAAELTSVRRMRDYCTSHARWNGVPQVRAALDLASDDSRSPNETRMRLVWVLDAELPVPAVNRPVYDLDGRLLGIPDLLDVAAGVVGEYDGEEHRRARRHARDVAREDRLRRHGLEVFRVTGPDLPQRGLLVERMHAARSRAKWLPSGERAWTTEDPASDGPAPTLDDLLDHQEWLADVYAAYERRPGAVRTG